MLSYRHHFHAGNFADVFKHIILMHLILALQKKDKGFFYLDTHSGSGTYDLKAEAAQRNREFTDGIIRISNQSQIPDEVAMYLKLVRDENGSSRITKYPGSPRIVRHLLRPQDKMVLCELHSSDYPLLNTLFAGDKQVDVRHEDGYQMLNALLPPREKRGLVLCDPAFEVKDERKKLVDAIETGYRKWSTGVYAIWYPIQDRHTTDAFYRAMVKTGIRKILLSEFFIKAESNTSPLSGCGMLVINPPWQFDEMLNRILPWLTKTLALDEAAKFKVDWLVPE